MNTEQNYVGGGDNATQLTQTAQNGAQTLPLVDNRQPATLTSPRTDSCVKLSLCVWQHEDKSSEVELVYWVLEAAKQAALERLLTTSEGSDEFEEHRFNSAKAQELQHTLFTLVSGLASDLSRATNGISHE